MPDISDGGHSNGAKGECSPEQTLQDCSVASRKMKLFHCSGREEEAFSGVQQYIKACKFLDSLSGRHYQGTMHEIFSRTIAEFAQVAGFTRVVDTEPKPTKDGSIELTVTVCQKMTEKQS